MTRSTRVILTPAGPMLASPVLAHSVEPGDLLLPLEDDGNPAHPDYVGRVLSVRRIDAADVPRDFGDPYPVGPPPWDGLTIAIHVRAHSGRSYTGYAPANQPLMRAVGARAARGGAR